MLSVPGVGKTSFAVALLMCLSRDMRDPEGACFRMSSERHFVECTFGSGFTQGTYDVTLMAFCMKSSSMFGNRLRVADV